MDIRPLTPRYAVSPQIDPADMAAIAAAGYGTVICNRPDAEIPPSHHAEVMEVAARTAGLDFVVLPLTHQTLGPDAFAAQRAVIEAAQAPVLAYCASGTRSTIVWAFGAVADQPVAEVIEAAANAGYDLGPFADGLATLSGG